MTDSRCKFRIGAILVIFMASTYLSTPAVAERSLPQAQAPGTALRFTHLTTKDGLSQDTITALLQDSRGFMWIGTQNGLNRYDGYEFTVYRHDPQSPNSLSHNHVTALYEAADGALWIATHGGGVNHFDPITETFTRYQRDSENPNSIAGNTIVSIFEDSRGDLWFGGLPERGGFTRFDPITQTSTRYARAPVSTEEPQGGAVWDMVEDADGNLWLAADSALAKFDPSVNPGQAPETEEFVYYTPDSGDRRLAALYQDGDGMIWVGGSEGLYRFDPSNEAFTLYQPDHTTPVADILPNDDGTFWIGTLGDGLYSFDTNSGQFLHHYTSDPLVESSPSHDKIEVLYRDRAGVVWVGTARGLNLYNPRQNQFVHYTHEAENPHSLAAGTVWGICGEPELASELWVGTGTTLNQLNIASGRVTHHPLVKAVTSGPTPVGIGAVYCDPDGFIWAGFGALVYRFDKASGEVTTYDLQTLSPPGAPPLTITAFCRDGSVLWIGAQRGGLIRFTGPAASTGDLQSGAFQLHLVPSPGSEQADSNHILNREVSALYKDRDGFIWLGYSSGGLSRLDPNTDTFRHYLPDPDDPYSISMEWITDIYQDQTGALWLAARNGLTRLDLQTETFTLYTARDGLPNAFVTGIERDRNGNLWLATMKGISQFNPSASSSTSSPQALGQVPRDEVFYNYDAADGVGSTEFSGASWQRQDGQIFFGGSDGLTAFYPDQVTVNTYQPPVVLTELRLDNELITPGADAVLDRAIWDTEQLTLRHDNDLVSFEFAALSYAAPHKHRYRYRLEGLEADWVTVDSRHRFATYTHLPAGDYVFRVQGTNDSGVWSAHEVALALTVLPAWWETWWFRGGAVVLLIGVVVAGIHWRMRDLERRSHILEAQVAERTHELSARTERLQESEERFATVMNSVQAMMYVADMETYELLFVNQTLRDIFGDVEGATCWHILQGNQAGPCDFCTNEHLLKDGHPTGIYTWEFQNRVTGRWYYIQDRAIRWVDGRWVRLEVATDITERKQAERELEESERRFREMTELLPGAVVEMDAEFTITYINRSGLVLFGYTEQDIQAGLNGMELIHPEERERAAQRIASHIEGKYVPPTEYRILKKDGTEMSVLLKAAPIRREGEIGGFRASLTDISKVKEAEKALKESEELYRQLVETAREAIFVVDQSGCFKFANSRTAELSGFTHEELLSKPVADLVHVKDRDFVSVRIRERLAGDVEPYSYQFRIVDKGGNVKWVNVSSVGITWKARPAGLVLASDITEMKKAEQELAAALDRAKRLRDKAQAANRAKSAFLANMSHELRTPLNAILGYSQLMARDVQHITPTQQEYLETITRSGEHLLNLINDVLTMSKIEAGRAGLQENAFDLHRQLQDLQEMFQLRATDKGLALRLEVAPDVPRYVYADEGKLRQVLTNLLSNAVKFTRQGSVTLGVKLDRDGDRDRDAVLEMLPGSEISVCFKVEDTGPGIAPEEMDALFDPFVQTASGQQSQEGTGLGLPISRQFVDLMGGQLDASSTFGYGTLFLVQIPMTVMAQDAVESLDLQPQRRVVGIEPGQSAPDGGSFRILVVEDKLTNRKLLTELLTPFGFDVRCAVNGAKGVEMWESWQPHLVWMDMRMPVMDGYEATQQIKARAAATDRQAIVVALTASAFEEDREAVLAAGCDDFVRKPFRERDIFDVLHRHLGLRFVYEIATLAPEGAASMSLEDLRAAVERLPATWAKDLYRAVGTLDADQMLPLIEAIRPQAPRLAETLARWVRNFEYDRLMALVAPEP